jgi:hypothetical protein
MITPTAEIRDWRDLQDRVAELFREMGYLVQSPFKVNLVRGQKEVDVFIEDRRTSVPHRILVECKHWANPVPQETVHSMRTIMQDSGANTGIIVSSAGFQSGAGEAAAMSNIHLMTWDALQVAYGHEWFFRQTELIAPLAAKLQLTDGLYLDQGEAEKSIANLMRFERMGTTGKLYEFLSEGRLVIFEIMGGPKSYDQPGPYYVRVPDGHPGAIVDKFGTTVVELRDVRIWFRWVRKFAQSVISRCEELETETFEAFDALEANEVELAFAKTRRLIREEAPIRVLRDLVGDAEYGRIIQMLESRPAASEAQAEPRGLGLSLSHPSEL